MTENVENSSWQWSQLDPMTRSVVAVFAWRIGDESQGDISSTGFIGAMAETFDDITTEDITKTAGWGGSEGMRNMMVNKLSGFDVEPISRMAQQLGQLAGDGEAVVALAAQAAEQLRSGYAHDAVPALRVLSELAIARR